MPNKYIGTLSGCLKHTMSYRNSYIMYMNLSIRLGLTHQMCQLMVFGLVTGSPEPFEITSVLKAYRYIQLFSLLFFWWLDLGKYTEISVFKY